MTDETKAEQPGTDTSAGVAEQPASPPEGAAEEHPESAPTEGQTEGQEAQGEEKKRPKLDQNVDIKDVGPCKKHIKVTIERDSINNRLDEKFKEIMPESAVAGFRPGKAPKALVRRRYRKEVADQVKAELLLESLEQLAEDNDIAPLSAPNLDPFKIDLPEQGPLVYEFEVEVRPHFDLPDYKGLKLKRPVKDFTDADVEQETRRLLAPYGQLVPKPEGNAQVGDVLVADVTSRDGDRILSTLNEAQVTVQPQLAFKDGVAEHFGDQVKGASAGDTREVDITLSDKVSDETLRGKHVKATFAVKDVKSVRLPELTHEFLHNFGVHNEEQFQELVRLILRRRLEYLQRQSARRQVMEKLAGNANLDLPRDLLARQARKALARQVMEMRANGIPEEEINGRVRLLEQDVLRSTAQALKEHFVLQKIAEDEKIDVSDDDLEDEIERIADQNNESARRVRARLEREDLMDALAAELIERKALDLILDSAEYEDEPLDTPGTAPVATVEEQTVPGEMHDPTAVPPEEEKPAEEKAAEGEQPAAETKPAEGAPPTAEAKPEEPAQS
jgi:trigger factor